MYKNVEVKFLDPWINLPPQPSDQNFVTCYGILKVYNEKLGGDLYYSMCELIEDDILTATQKNSFEKQKHDSHQRQPEWEEFSPTRYEMIEAEGFDVTQLLVTKDKLKLGRAHSSDTIILLDKVGL